uniref:Replication-associated protein n=1 Tax=Rodent circovirus TaxID=2050016 RepID=A0A2H4MZZ1_9CIRC|nr:Rep [Rodent circovirus]
MQPDIKIMSDEEVQKAIENETQRFRPKQESPSIRWCFTLNNYSEKELTDLKAWLDGTKVYIAIIGMEQGEKGTPHLQGYLELASKERRTSLSRLNPRIHWEKAMGDRVQNYRYCTKEGNIWYQKGEESQWSTSRKEDEKWTNIRNWAKKGQLQMIEQNYPREFIIYERQYQRIAAEERMKTLGIFQGDLKKKNVWIWGEPGTGKSKWANSQCPIHQIYRKMASKWWDGYDINSHKLILIEDWPSLTELDMGHHIKLWSDRYPFKGETKGGMVAIDPNTPVIITSNYPIDVCFKPGDVEAVRRRFTHINLTNDNQALINDMKLF